MEPKRRLSARVRVETLWREEPNGKAMHRVWDKMMGVILRMEDNIGDLFEKIAKDRHLNSLVCEDLYDYDIHLEPNVPFEVFEVALKDKWVRILSMKSRKFAKLVGEFKALSQDPDIDQWLEDYIPDTLGGIWGADGVPADHFEGLYDEMRYDCGEEEDYRPRLYGSVVAPMVSRVLERKGARFLTPPINSPQSEPVNLILHKVEVEREYNTPWYWVEVDGVNESWITKSLSSLPHFGFDFTYTLAQRGSIRLEWRQPDHILQSGEGADRREFQGWARKMEKAVRNQISIINREIKGGRKTNVKTASLTQRVAHRYLNASDFKFDWQHIRVLVLGGRQKDTCVVRIVGYHPVFQHDGVWFEDAAQGIDSLGRKVQEHVKGISEGVDGVVRRKATEFGLSENASIKWDGIGTPRYEHGNNVIRHSQTLEIQGCVDIEKFRDHINTGRIAPLFGFTYSKGARLASSMSQSQFWSIVDTLGWGTKTVDYDRIKTHLLERLTPEVGMAFSDMKKNLYRQMYKHLDRWEEENEDDRFQIGDDSYSDLIHHIIGLGKREYEAVLRNPELAAQRAAKWDFKESFAYAVPFSSEWKKA